MTSDTASKPLPLPEFQSRAFLRQHAADILAFYHPRCVDENGGFFHFFRDDGTIYDRQTRHLVSSTRFIFDYAMAWRHFGDPDYLQQVTHGLNYLRNAHRNPETGGYGWVLHDNQIVDDSIHCYGLAFVALAYAKALEAGIPEARAWLDETWELMEKHFWLPQHGLYADEANADWTVSDYRGQNANMHTCEAWLAAFEATGSQRYLERAHLIAKNMTQRQAALTDGMIWEHFHTDWSPDWSYNYGDRSDIFKPWGFQPGHQTEWAKLLLIIDRHIPADWHLARARELFDRAIGPAWDTCYGGMVYGLDRKGHFYDEDKYHWVQAESLTTAALLAKRTGDAVYSDWYLRLWKYCWQHFVDHQYGAWYRILQRDNSAIDDAKSPAGKTDYHTLGACFELLDHANLIP